MKEIVQKWRRGTDKSGKRFSSRYIGSMVGEALRWSLWIPRRLQESQWKAALVVRISIRVLRHGAGRWSLHTQWDVSVSWKWFQAIVHQGNPVIMGSTNDVEEVIEANAN